MRYGSPKIQQPIGLSFSILVIDLINMADEIFMYGATVVAFAILTGFLFWSRGRRRSEEKRSAPSTVSSEKRGAI
ncbi:MAG TPA: hypothetical protein VE130_14405 [Nitrososphaeraceae archaeon]|jgi:hypothetical protein|nr:hypothetical protein [Nitrososphaeraceae archaeon]